MDALPIIAETLRHALSIKKEVHFCVTGGRSPEKIYAGLSTLFRNLAWERLHLWFSDDRCVPESSPLSNAAFVRRMLAEPLNIPEKHFHIIQGGLPPAEAAARYNIELHRIFPVLPCFDAVLLGMGDDGHIASLFPGRIFEETPDVWAEAVGAPAHIEPHIERVTLTLSVLNHAAKRFVLVSGEHKNKLFNRIYPHDKTYPVCRLRSENTTFFRF